MRIRALLQTINETITMAYPLCNFWEIYRNNLIILLAKKTRFRSDTKYSVVREMCISDRHAEKVYKVIQFGKEG